MTLCIIITLIGAAVLFLYVKEKIRSYSPLALMLKSAVSFLFISVAVAGQLCRGGDYGIFVIGALVCGLLGDIWLDLKYVYPDDSEKYTFAGFMAFGCGHILFITGLILNYASLALPFYIIIPAVIGIAGGVVTGASGSLMGLDYGKYKKIVMVYGALLFGMTVLSGSLALQHSFSEPALNLMFIGGILFAASDLVLSGTYFGEGRERPADLIANYILYYGAQFVIAWSVMFA